MKWIIQEAKEDIELNYSGVKVTIPKGVKMWEGKAMMLFSNGSVPIDATKLETRQLEFTLPDTEIKEKFNRSIFEDKQ